MKRYDALLDATELLLQTEDPDEVGLYRIADQAGVPPASAYHFFPTREAVYTALAMRVTDRLLEVHREPIAASRIQTWQDLFRVDIERARAFFNRHSAGMKILYGGFGGVDGRNVDRAVSSRLSHAGYARLDQLFHMPFLREPQRKFENRLAILDALWSVSVRQFGHIDEEYFEESFRACIAYSRTFMPERVEVREAHRRAAEEGALVCLPFEDFIPDADAVSDLER